MSNWKKICTLSAKSLVAIFSIFVLSCTEDESITNFQIFCGKDNHTICLTLNDTLTQADGVSTIDVIAYIPSIADPENRTVTFTSTTGSFRTESNPAMPMIEADMGGAAKTTLTIGNIPGKYRVTAKVTAGTDTFSDEKWLTLEPPNEQVVTLDLDSSNVPADGISVITLTATVSQGFYDGSRKVKFIAGGAGKFQLPSDPNDSSVTSVVIDETFTAKANLVVGTSQGKYPIVAQIESEPQFSDETMLTLTPLENNLVLTVTPDLESLAIRANGFTTIPVTVKVDGINIVEKMVRLEAIGGWSLLDQSSNDVRINLDDTGEVSAILKVGQVVDRSIFRATVDNFSVRSDVSLLASNPSTMQVIPDSSNISAQNDEVEIVAYLFRRSGEGKVSLDSRVFFEAYQERDSQLVEIFGFDAPFAKSTVDEKAIITFKTPADSSVVIGTPITIRAITFDDQGKEVLDGISLQVLK